MRANSLGSNTTRGVMCQPIPQKSLNIQQIEVIENELKNRQKTWMNYIYDYWYVPNILIGGIFVLINTMYLIQMENNTG